MSVNSIAYSYPGGALALTRLNYWPADLQAELEALIGEIEGAGDGLPPHLQNLWDAMPDELDFLEYACDVWSLRDPIVRAYRASDWDAYVRLHPDYLRLFAFGKAVEEGLGGEAYWQLLTSVYTQDDYSGVNRDSYLAYYTADEPPGRRAAMNPDELRVFDALPEVVTAYRGTTPEKFIGLSWTLERPVAEFFARRCRGQVYTAQVPREAVLAYYGERNEAEVLIDFRAPPDGRYEVLLGSA